MRQFLTATFLLLLLHINLSAQNFLRGKVLDNNGRTLTGAKVIIRESSSTALTDQSGEFKFDKLVQELVTLTISYIGYEQTTIQTQTDKTITITLQPQAVSINEITVTSLRATNKSAVAYTDLKKEEFDKRNLGQDIPYLLALTPSFITTSDAGTGIGYTGFRIRGTDSNRTNVTINGVPLNDAESHGIFFVNMPDFSSSVSSFQVQRGVGTSTNGAAAFGASINIQTEGLNIKPYGEISTTLGSFNTNKNMLKVGSGLLNNHFAFDARLSNITSNGYIDRASADMKSYYFSAGYYTGSTALKFITFGGKEKTYMAWNGVDSEIMKVNRTYNELGEYKDSNGNTKYYDNQTDNYTQIHNQLHWLQEFNPRLHLNITLHYTRGYGYYEEYKTNLEYKEYGLTPDTIGGIALTATDLVQQKWLDNYFYGLTFALNYNLRQTNFTLGGAANEYDGQHYGKIMWVRFANNPDIDKDWYRSRSVKKDANIYAKTTSELLKGLFGNFDLQYRYISYSMKGTDDKYDESTKSMRDITTKKPYVFNFFNPKIGLTYKIDKQQSLFASYSIANREPNRTNYTERWETDESSSNNTLPKNNTLPTNETLYDTEIGYQFHANNFSLGANLYYMKYKNQLILTGKINKIGELLSTNIPDSYRKGIELTAGTKIYKWLRWDGNATFSQNKIKHFTEEDIDEYDANGNWTGSKSNYLGTTDIAYSPNVIANSIFTATIHNFELGFASSYVGKQYFDNTSNNDRSINAYFVNNLSTKYTVHLPGIQSLEFRVLVNNLFNEVYSSNAYSWYSYYLDGKRINEKRYFPQAGTNWMTSISVKF